MKTELSILFSRKNLFQLRDRLRCYGIGFYCFLNHCILIGLVTLSLSFLPNTSFADIAIIVNKDSSLSVVTAKEVSALFLAKTNRLNGTSLKPIDMPNGNSLRNDFYLSMTKKSAMQMKAYWSRLIFTGKGIPPPVAESAEDVIDIISEELNYIGYVNTEDTGNKVKVLLTLPTLNSD